MKRQLLLQEANNLLLQADIARRETELNWHKQHARKGTPIKRWNTYGGMESRVVSIEDLLNNVISLIWKKKKLINQL